jgi:hypothetical protein
MLNQTLLDDEGPDQHQIKIGLYLDAINPKITILFAKIRGGILMLFHSILNEHQPNLYQIKIGLYLDAINPTLSFLFAKI